MKTKSMTIWVMVVVLCVSSSQVMAWIQFNDGGAWDINYEINDDVWVDWEAPGMQTTVNWLDGGNISLSLQGYEDSRLNISGGSIGGRLYAYNSSQVTMSGGSIGDWLDARNSTQVTVSGGSIDEGLSASGSSQVTVSGGSIGQWLYANNSSQVTIFGGSIDDGLRASGNSQVTVFAGSIGGELIAQDYGNLTIHGWDFAVDGMPVGYTELYSILGGNYYDEPHRQLTGTLLSGDPINNGFYIGNNASIVLVPEPASAVILGLGGFFLVLRRRRRQA